MSRLISSIRRSMRGGVFRISVARPLASRSTEAAGEFSPATWKQDRCSTVRLPNCKMEFRTGHMARFASGSAVLTQEGNSILGTVVCKQSTSPMSGGGIPLVVDFKQSAAAVGRIPTNYLRRELGQSDQDVMISRIIDRTLRPIFPNNYSHATHVVCKPLSLDVDSGDIALMGINVASAALATSPVPTRCHVAAVRIALVDGKVIINPTREMRKKSILDMVLGGSDEGKVLMIEMDGKEVSTDTLLESIQTGLAWIDEVIAAIRQLGEGVEKRLEAVGIETTPPQEDLQFEGYCAKLEAIFSDATHDKTSRDEAVQRLKEEWALGENSQDPPTTTTAAASLTANRNGQFNEFLKRTLRTWTIRERRRCDGRGLDEVRPIHIEVDVYKRLHGSALFQRGQTQVLSTVTFDSPQAAFHPDAIAQLLGTQQRKSFMLHYEFPQFAVNDVGAASGSSRREIGHGMLAEKALKHMVPAEFPYTIRLACQVLESNGSSSMASVCAGSLALMDAGVPLSSPVAGIAVGLFKDGDDKECTFLTDLLGMEDYFGDMDMKLAGTRNGFTALQLDFKSDGLTLEQLSEACNRGRAGIEHVLGKMAEVLGAPRPSFKPTVPVMEEMIIPHYKKAVLFRSGGYNAKLVAAEFGVQLASEEENKVTILAPNKEKLKAAKEFISHLLADNIDELFTFGQLYKAEIVDILEHGVMVTLKKGAKPILMRNIDLSPQRVGHASALGLKVGQHLVVQYFGRDQVTGFHRISRRTINSTELALEDRLGRESGKTGDTKDV